MKCLLVSVQVKSNPWFYTCDQPVPCDAPIFPWHCSQPLRTEGGSCRLLAPTPSTGNGWWKLLTKTQLSLICSKGPFNVIHVSNTRKQMGQVRGCSVWQYMLTQVKISLNARCQKELAINQSQRGVRRNAIGNRDSRVWPMFRWKFLKLLSLCWSLSFYVYVLLCQFLIQVMRFGGKKRIFTICGLFLEPHTVYVLYAGST